MTQSAAIYFQILLYHRWRILYLSLKEEQRPTLKVVLNGKYAFLYEIEDGSV